MLLALASVLGLLPFSGVFAGQIPVVDGVIGGVPDASTLPEPQVFTSSAAVVTTPGKLRVVENSGIGAETTPGVYQASGYGDLTATESIWFWFFASRKNPENAPLMLWFNGGPGSSSMIGLLQEHGPCRITNDSTAVTLNPFSWNNEANVLYIDQPVGVGFSHGNTTVGTSWQAAADMWTFLQIFLSDKRFKKLANNKLALWTESYGGHYGPTFAAHFLAQNEAIKAKKATGIHLNLEVLGVGDGLTDPLLQYPGYLSYSASNPYHPLVNDTVLAEATSEWIAPAGCQAQIAACNNNGNETFWNTTICSRAQNFCNNNILSPLAGIYDVYYVPTPDPDPYPPAIAAYLNQIAPMVGGEVTWKQSSNTVYNNFAATGDWMRNSRPDLETVINAGVRTIVYDGDADYILNFNGVEAMVDALETKFTAEFKQQEFQTFKVAGQKAGQFKNAGTFSYVRIYGAGHEVPAYRFGTLQTGQAAAQMFTQIMSDKHLSST